MKLPAGPMRYIVPVPTAHAENLRRLRAGEKSVFTPAFIVIEPYFDEGLQVYRAKEYGCATFKSKEPIFPLSTPLPFGGHGKVPSANDEPHFWYETDQALTIYTYKEATSG